MKRRRRDGQFGYLQVRWPWGGGGERSPVPVPQTWDGMRGGAEHSPASAGRPARGGRGRGALASEGGAARRQAPPPAPIGRHPQPAVRRPRPRLRTAARERRPQPPSRRPPPRAHAALPAGRAAAAGSRGHRRPAVTDPAAARTNKELRPSPSVAPGSAAPVLAAPRGTRPGPAPSAGSRCPRFARQPQWLPAVLGPDSGSSLLVLAARGLDGRTLCCVKRWLNGRTQRAVVGGVKSSCLPVTCVVP